MKPILQSIARAYIDRYADLSKVCFLFPNKRCGIFLKKYLDEEGYPKDKKLPKIFTISEFVSMISGKKEAGKIDAIFTLYNCYLNVLKKKFSNSSSMEINFDSFRNWAEIVLSDFNIVDQYLVNPKEIFVNVTDFRSLTSNFLTEDQKEVLKEYFGHEDFGDTSGFWKNFEEAEKLSPLRERFLNLWQILDDLYEELTAALAEERQALAGRLYREAAEIIKEKGASVLKFKKIVVFGFNALNGAERSIFKTIQSLPGNPGYDAFADFVWDATGPILTSEDNSGSKFILSNIKRFPMAEWLQPAIDESSTDKYPDIRIISSPSNTMQVKIAGQLIGEKLKVAGCNLRDHNTSNFQPPTSQLALILPDESLMPIALSSLPVETVNVTMGYSFRQTGVATYINLFRRLYSNMRVSRGDKLFYHKDLKLFLSHPYAFLLFTAEQINKLIKYIDKHHKITISLEEMKHYLTDPQVCFNPPAKDDNSDAVLTYIEEMLTMISDLLAEPSEGNEEKNNLEISFINLYIENLKQLKDAIQKHGMTISSMGQIYLLERIVGNTRLTFEGEPLEGLQVMGTLETRGLDFKEVIITSMNEGMMPRRAKVKSFIPETIRKGYGLPPSRYSEEIFAYYFYRLISRAERVTLIYDSRIGGGMKRGGESRYLLQLRYLAPKGVITEEKWNFTLSAKENSDASVVKTPEIKALLQPYLNVPGKNFSASILNYYRECQVFFFLRRLLGINPDPETTEFIDAITVGNVLHDVMMRLYIPDEKKQKKLLETPIIIDKKTIEDILEDPDHIMSLIVSYINIKFYQQEETAPLPESSEIVAQQILYQIEEILRHDLSLAPFKLYGCEISDDIRVTLDSGRTVNFTFAIDRLDAINFNGEERLRIVDYKTGKRKRNAKSIDEVLHGDYRSEQVFQLFTYAWLLKNYDVPGKEDVLTEIYFVPDFVKGELGLPKINRSLVTGFKEYADEFDKGIQQLVNDIFDSDTFRQPESDDACRFCAFRQLCGK